MRSIFLNTIISKNPKYEEFEEITNLIKSWQASHIILLRILESPEDFNLSVGNPVIEQRGATTSLLYVLQLLLPEWEKYKIVRTWQTLYDNHIHNTPSIHGMVTDRGIAQLDNRLTDFGKKVTQYLQIP